MRLSFKVETVGVPDGEPINFGPFDQETGTQQSIPTFFSRRVLYPELEVAAIVECIFTGDKLEIQRISVENNGKFVSTKVLTQLALPAVIRALAIEVVPNARLWAELKPNQEFKLESPTFLAQVYWFEHISWGSPRGSIMTYMSWSRTNANFHISKIARDFPLPGPHSQEKVSKGPQRSRGN